MRTGAARARSRSPAATSASEPGGSAVGRRARRARHDGVVVQSRGGRVGGGHREHQPHRDGHEHHEHQHAHGPRAGESAAATWRPAARRRPSASSPSRTAPTTPPRITAGGEHRRPRRRTRATGGHARQRSLAGQHGPRRRANGGRARPVDRPHRAAPSCRPSRLPPRDPHRLGLSLIDSDTRCRPSNLGDGRRPGCCSSAASRPRRRSARRSSRAPAGPSPCSPRSPGATASSWAARSRSRAAGCSSPASPRVTAYRRALQPFEVREHVVPLLSEALTDEPADLRARPASPGRRA